MSELKSCPFCGSKPEYEYKGGSCFNIDCCSASVSIQICDLMTIEERLAEPDLCLENGYRHQQKYIDRAEKEAVEAWNNRPTEDALMEALPDPNKLEILASWFDGRDDRRGFCGKREVQEDLRKWAAASRAALKQAGVKDE